MTTQQDLEKSVRRMFSSYAAASLKVPGCKGSLYELYIFLLTYTVLKQDKTACIVPPAGGFKFRTSPGIINNKDFVYIEFAKNGSVYELRNGIEVHGHNMYHETDIGLFRGRQKDGARPQNTNLALCIECKNHSKPGSLKGEVRKFLGCMTDLSGNHHNQAGCIHCGVGFKAYFATPLNPAASCACATYLASYKLGAAFNLRPKTVEEKQFKRQLKAFKGALDWCS